MNFRLRDSHPLRLAFPNHSTNPHNNAGRLVDLPSNVPQPRTRNPYQVSHAHGLASSAFARHYSRNHQCFLFLRVLRCFTSPRSPSYPIYSGMNNPTSLGLGYPIRTPSDHSSVDNSPRTIAVSHVLHRLLVPRHPPCALHNLATKMLAPTIQFSNNNQTHKKTQECVPSDTQQRTAPATKTSRLVCSTIHRAPQHTNIRRVNCEHSQPTGPGCCCSLERR
jgi:hypothetical protein